MKGKVLAVSLTVILLVAGTAGARGAAAQPPAWEQVNTNGFGNPHEEEVSALAVFGSYLYAATANPTDGARIFRSSDGLAWTAVSQPGFGVTHDTRPPAILDLEVFNNRLYASTGRGDGPGQVWYSLNGTTWTPLVIHGFGQPDTVDISDLIVFNGQLYAGATNQVSGAQVWRYTGNSNIWEQVAPDGPAPANAGVTALVEFGSVLYAVVESAGPVQVWRSSNGSNWTTLVSNGFGDSFTSTTGGMAVYAGSLYVGAGNANTGAQLWRSVNGAAWQQVIQPGFGDANNQKVEEVFAWQNQLYASVKNTQTGLELWRLANGTTWEQANADGFGDSHNSASNRGNAAAEFLGSIYVGTVNVLDGGELWRQPSSTPPPGPFHDLYLPLAVRRP